MNQPVLLTPSLVLHPSRELTCMTNGENTAHMIGLHPDKLVQLGPSRFASL